jgi:hypothetical protein
LNFWYIGEWDLVRNEHQPRPPTIYHSKTLTVILSDMRRKLEMTTDRVVLF